MVYMSSRSGDRLSVAAQKAALRARGVDAADHASQPLTHDMVQQADYIYCMSPEHCEMVIDLVPSAAVRVELLDAMRAELPPEIADRTDKMGFPVPLAEWPAIFAKGLWFDAVVVVVTNLFFTSMLAYALSRNELAAWYAAASIFVSPSTICAISVPNARSMSSTRIEVSSMTS